MKIGFGVGAVAAALVLAFAGGAGDAATVGGCTIAGTASFTPGLRTAAAAVSYTFSGKLNNCKNNTDKTATTATVSASGSGAKVSCTGGGTSGSGTLTWNNGKTSSFSFTTTGAGNLVKVSGKISSGEFAGTNLTAALAFSTLTPTACNTTTGLKTAGFNGAGTI